MFNFAREVQNRIPIRFSIKSILKKKMLELKKEMCKHLAEDSFNADDADACSNV